MNQPFPAFRGHATGILIFGFFSKEGMDEMDRHQKITSEVVGKIKNGKVVLYHHGKTIGHIPLDEKLPHLEEGYQFKNGDIHSSLIPLSQPSPDSYVSDCDLGWC
jgi:hypothetical protein